MAKKVIKSFTAADEQTDAVDKGLYCRWCRKDIVGFRSTRARANNLCDNCQVKMGF